MTSYTWSAVVIDGWTWSLHRSCRRRQRWNHRPRLRSWRSLSCRTLPTRAGEVRTAWRLLTRWMSSTHTSYNPTRSSSQTQSLSQRQSSLPSYRTRHSTVGGKPSFTETIELVVKLPKCWPCNVNYCKLFSRKWPWLWPSIQNITPEMDSPPSNTKKRCIRQGGDNDSRSSGSTVGNFHSEKCSMARKYHPS